MDSTAADAAPARAVFCIALLTLLGFSLGCSEFIVIGIEQELADSFSVSLSTIGQLISLFALPYAIITPVLALSTGRFKRYHLLIVYSVVFCLGNLLQTVAGSFEVLLASRIIMGSVSGALLAVGVTYIPELVGLKRVPIVISIIYGAFSVAMILATSLGKIIADTADWHIAIVATLVLACISCAACIAFMPKTGQTDEAVSFAEQAQLFKEPAILSGMLIFVFGVGSVYVFYGYITPYLEQILSLDAAGASTTLLIYGCFCFVSNILGGVIDSKFGMKALLLTFVMQACVMAGIWLVGDETIPALVLIFALALLMYVVSVSVISLFMNIAMRKHKGALTLASSLEPMAFNIGISFGTAVGGLVIATIGMQQVGLVGAVFSLVACALVALTLKLAR